MELQLALSLSSSSSSCSSSCTTKLDLNYYNNDNVEEQEMKMEDMKRSMLFVINGDQEETAGFPVPQTLPLLFCNKSNQEHDVDLDDVNEVQSSFFIINHKNVGEGNKRFGWPPVKSSRKNLCYCSGDGSNSMYVKVHMEGDGIARKIDLNLHNSYFSLIHTLANMFKKCNKDVKLTYQDKEGDWLLAGDVPWGSFIESVQRLKLIKS
ncbi:auxin-induced protein 22D-like [Rutidosis leptorrhynchoides]|uniref:auxin-induced protein 22D-like n=1 Tax=Rutidosis leptorrhynchoides TaxID=125765 RepID=UPI003A99FAE8